MGRTQNPCTVPSVGECVISESHYHHYPFPHSSFFPQFPCILYLIWSLYHHRHTTTQQPGSYLTLSSPLSAQTTANHKSCGFCHPNVPQIPSVFSIVTTDALIQALTLSPILNPQLRIDNVTLILKTHQSLTPQLAFGKLYSRNEWNRNIEVLRIIQCFMWLRMQNMCNWCHPMTGLRMNDFSVPSVRVVLSDSQDGQAGRDF